MSYLIRSELPPDGAWRAGRIRLINPSRLVAAWIFAVAPALSGCADALGPADLESEAPAAFAAGGNGNGRGNGGGGSGGGGSSDAVVDDLDPWDPAAWIPQSHPLGRGNFIANNVSESGGVLSLALSAGAYDGAEIRSDERVRHRTVEARMRTPDADGSISAFFLYELVPSRNDEIDIEILNDGSREIWFTTWVADRQTNHTEHVLPFDPAAGFHDYRIEWTRKRVRFYVDGQLLEEFGSGIPRDAMYVMSNAWWPVWLSGPKLSAPQALEIDRLIR